MRSFKMLAAVLLLAVPALSQAEIGSVPGDSAWYFHADFDAMRKGKASRGLYEWLDAEVFAEIRKEIGIDFNKEARYVTAFSARNDGPIIVFDGNIEQETKDKLMAMGAAASGGNLEPLKAHGKEFFHFEGDGDAGGDVDIDIESLEEEAYISFALKDKIVITHRKEQMEALLANNGRIPTARKDRNTLFVLQADRALMQAGVNTNAFEGDEWDSNIVRNTKQVAVLLADLGDKLGLEARLITTEPEMANSLASIVRGLVSLSMFSDDMDPDMAEVLQGTTVDVDDATLRVGLELDPESVVSALED
ncbi:MAG: hypothetical protein KJP08_04465 [Gammaproteobacteria bacterium]|nr:hypothetical protein [Gammaproteobacteria bacterium]NNF50610.1 hypothetical protein [Woeseiaceae bacterium]MBT8094041.1 hypothetical protein [Gammaproteobacteria bacterium]MBT8105700.1 hypothetical protein [Gammaproteobacteria bacterium]NNK25714.1 hypothetical protein [Woeseiaceae bacterium]